MFARIESALRGRAVSGGPDSVSVPKVAISDFSLDGARYQPSRELSECCRMNDLKFTEDECVTFVNGVIKYSEMNPQSPMSLKIEIEKNWFSPDRIIFVVDGKRYSIPESLIPNHMIIRDDAGSLCIRVNIAEDTQNSGKKIISFVTQSRHTPSLQFEVVDGKIDLIHHATHKELMGKSYTGKLRNGKPSGKGSLVGVVRYYQGDFGDGVPHGEGTEATLMDGGVILNKITGTWEHGTLIKCTYSGTHISSLTEDVKYTYEGALDSDRKPSGGKVTIKYINAKNQAQKQSKSFYMTVDPTSRDILCNGEPLLTTDRKPFKCQVIWDMPWGEIRHSVEKREMNSAGDEEMKDMPPANNS